MFSRIVLALAAASIAPSALAHSPYLLPNAFDVADGDTVSVQASFTEHFFVPDVAMKSDTFAVTAPDGRVSPLTPVYTRAVTILDVDLGQTGTYRISSGARRGNVRKAVLDQGEWKFLRGSDAVPANATVYEMTSITQAVVYVTRGPASESALAPTGKGLELQLLSHPAKL